VTSYQRLAGEIAEQIAAGSLRPGERLPTQREFAARHQIAGSTAERVYAELIRRGLAAGEVGRGTFVRAAAAATGRADPAEPGLQVNLDYNFPILPDQHVALAASLARLLRPDAAADALRPAGPAGTPAIRRQAAAFLGRAGWQPQPGAVLFAGNGKQGIAAAIAALVPAGGRLGVETFTYPVVKAIAARLGVRLVPLPVDEDGVRPAGLRSAHRAGRLDAVYLQPSLHNPLGVTMPAERREEVAALLTGLGIDAIEDAVYSFLRDEPPPLAFFAPGRTVYVDSLSKRAAPGLTAGFLVPPDRLTEALAAALRSGAWTAGRFALEAAGCWLADGTMTALTLAKRADAASRQAVAARQLAGFDLSAEPSSYHCWWRLPGQWRADTFVAAAARRGIAVTPAAEFAVSPGQAPNAVRLALASPPAELLPAALADLGRLARGTPEDAQAD
jgi:DNA-binding transcriptional MocR family regulator